MKEPRIHPYITTLKQQFAEGKVDRREFLRTSTLLGLSATAAYAFVGKVTGENFATPAKADMPRGGTIRVGSRVKDIKTPHTYSWGYWDSNVSRQVVEYLTEIGHDNISRPYLLESWEASDDLKIWTLHLRKGIKWHKGRDLTADDVVWNLNHVLDDATGSSVQGLMAGYMLEDYDTGGKDENGNPKMGKRLWDASAIEKVDDHTIRLNCKEAQIAVPEHLFHYALAIVDPEENAIFVPGSNGTGPFDLVEHEVGKRSVLKARNDYWGQQAYVEQLEYVELGDDPSTGIAGLASKQFHGIVVADPVQFEALSALEHLQIYEAPSAETSVMRVKVTQAPFTDARVRKALRLAVDPESITQAALRGLGIPGEHHHVSPIHPEYAKLPFMERNVDEAKRLLAEAGFPDGFDTEIATNNESPWEVVMVQAAVEQWKEAGIRVKINLLPGAQFWEIWDKVPFGSTVWYHRPLGTMILGLAYRTGVPWNESEYANPEFDRLLVKAEGILDVDKRREVMVELERIMQEDGPIVQPVWRNNFTFFDKRVKGFKMHPTAFIFGNRLAIEA